MPIKSRSHGQEAPDNPLLERARKSLARGLGSGDIVALNSGGPNMLVMRVVDGYATCTWAADPTEHVLGLMFSKFRTETLTVLLKAPVEAVDAA